jgi:hypothetical protein
LLTRDVLDDSSPPALPSDFDFPVTIRYQKTNATIANVYWRALANLLIVSVSTTSGYVIYNNFRLRKVTCFGLASSASGATGYQTPVVRLTMYGPPIGPDVAAAQPVLMNRRKAEDVSTNDRGCKVSLVPLQSQNRYDVYALSALTYSNSAFTVEGPIGTLVDVSLTVNLFGSIRTTLPKTSTTTGATAQVAYFNLLDNTSTTGSAGTSYLTPISCGTALVNGAVWL